LRVTAQEWQRLSPLVDEALDVAAGERARWVERLPDLSPSLREKLRALIAKHGAPETRNFLETAPLVSYSGPRVKRSSDWRSDDVIGTYTLVRALGHGGMGEVWLAKRSDGAYQRNVALKLPATDAAPARVRERMIRERDVLASLEHPNIARFYDAGVTGSGQPFLAMEFVEGDTLSVYAAVMQLSVRDRCKLFLQVLSAVQFAHQHLVVHRDLKPSNVMVRDTGTVALLDFGIAKVLDEASLLGDESQLTRETGRALTLAYAAPEQILAEPISTATDVFAAGVLFYELLCDTRPFAKYENNMSAMIKAHEAPLKTLPKALGGDLNAIVARALRRDPGERYVSASAFSDDIKRYLDDQPVIAMQGARWYGFAKFLKRQRAALAVASLGLVAVASTSVAGLWQYDLARTRGVQAKSADTLLAALLEAVSPDNAASRTFTAVELLDRAMALTSSAAGDAVDENYQFRIAKLYYQVGESEKARDLFRAIVDRLPGDSREPIVLDSHGHLARLAVHSNRWDAFDNHLERIDQAVAASPADGALRAEAQLIRGLKLWRTGRLGEAKAQFAAADAALHSMSTMPVSKLAELRELMGHTARGLSEFSEARRLFRGVAELDALPNGRGAVARLAARLHEVVMDVDIGEYENAITVAEGLLPSLRERAGDSAMITVSCEMAHATALVRMGQMDRAETALRRVEARVTGAVATTHLPRLRRTLAQIRMYRGDSGEAERVFAELLRSTLDGPPSLSMMRERVLLAESILRQGRTKEALELLRQSESQLIVLHGEDHAELSSIRALMGIALMRQGQWLAAQSSLSFARERTLRGRSADHSVAVAAELYLKLIPALRTGVRIDPPFALKAPVFAWQHEAQALTAWFESPQRQTVLSQLPVVF
jgi:tetratricopeptide (TPR) repeat protein